jgi:hypothetical protein
MSLSFRSLAVVTAVICFALTGAWLIAPNILLGMWGVEYSYAVGLVARRAGALFLAIGIMFFLARNAEYSQSRTALAVGISTGCFALAVLGIFEFVTGHAGIGIWSAIIVEVGLACLFLIFLRKPGQNTSS